MLAQHWKVLSMNAFKSAFFVFPETSSKAADGFVVIGHHYLDIFCVEF
jgi:hypothetical protein